MISVESDAKVPGYRLNEGPAVAYRAALAAADAADTSTLLGLPTVGHQGHQTVAVSGRFAAAAGNSVVVHCLRYDKNDVLFSSSKATLTSELLTDGALFLAPAVYFDTQGAIKSRLVVELPTSAVDLYAEVF